MSSKNKVPVKVNKVDASPADPVVPVVDPNLGRTGVGSEVDALSASGENLPKIAEGDENFGDAVIGVDPALEGEYDGSVIEYQNLVFDNRHVKLAVGLVLRGSHDDMFIETNDGVTLCSITAPARTFPAFV